MGTGPQFIYNVYIKNIHNLFEGDIDSIIACFREYFEQAKQKYNEIVHSSMKGGEVKIGFSKLGNVLQEAKEGVCESSEAEVSTTAVNELDDKKKQ